MCTVHCISDWYTILHSSVGHFNFNSSAEYESSLTTFMLYNYVVLVMERWSVTQVLEKPVEKPSVMVVFIYSALKSEKP